MINERAYMVRSHASEGEVADLRNEIAELKATLAAASENHRDAWAALAMIREAIETLGPVGALPSSEAVSTNPQQGHFLDEAAAIVAAIQKMGAENERLRTALERIERWFGEFPDTGERWQDGSPMSYSAAYGSNGERDFMRGVARAALAGEPR